MAVDLIIRDVTALEARYIPILVEIFMGQVDLELWDDVDLIQVTNLFLDALKGTLQNQEIDQNLRFQLELLERLTTDIIDRFGN